MRIFLFLFIFLLTNCSTNSESPKKADELVISVNETFSEINPFYNQSTYSAHVQALTFDTLIKLNSKGEIRPDICSQFKPNTSHTEWICTLNENITYQDGSKFNLKDIEYSLNIRKKIKGPYYSSAENIVNLQVLDTNKIKFSLHKFDRTFLQFLTAFYIVSPNHFKPDGYPTSPSNVLGTGPYKIMSADSNSVSLNFNPDYFLGRPHIEKIRFQYYRDNASALKDLIEAKVQLQAYFDFTHEDILENIDYIQHIDSDSAVLFGIFFNSSNPTLSNQKMRQALNYFVDTESILNKEGLISHSFLANSVVSPMSTLYNSEIKHYQYNPTKGDELLKQLGYSKNKNNYYAKNDKELNLSLILSEASYISEKMTQQIVKYLDSAGVKITLHKLTMDNLIQKALIKKDYDLLLSNYSDDLGFLANYLVWHSTDNAPLNFTNYNNSVSSILLEEARYTADESTFKTKYQEFQKTLYDDPPMLYLFWYNYPIYYNKDLKGISSDLFNNISALKDAWISNETH